jgi:hypothetical protein
MPRPVDVERRTRPSVATWCVTVFALAAMYTTAGVRTGTWQTPSTALVALLVLSCTALAFRTLRPLLVLAVVVGIEVCMLVFLAVPELVAARTEGMGAFQPVPLGTMLAAWTVAARTPRRVGWGAAVAAGGVLMVTGLLAHNLTLVNAQAGVAEYLLASRPEAAAEALRGITQHTSRAIDELRATIGLLRYDGADGAPAVAVAGADPVDRDDPGAPMRPVPGVAALDELVASHRSTGHRVDVRSTGTPGRLDQHADLAAYRIVQEALTNAAKHAPGMPVEVHLAWSEAGVRVRVVNAAVQGDPRRPAPPGTGHGLIGMRERALAAGGGLRVGEIADDRFEVVATLPAGRQTTSGPGVPPDAPPGSTDDLDPADEVPLP